ncbi:MAG: DUF3108 domain-containing protein [Gemmatimonadota bacterium]
MNHPRLLLTLLILLTPLTPLTPLMPLTASAQNGMAVRRPFGPGESLIYDVRYGFLNVGTATMDVLGTTSIRDRGAWHVRLRIAGGIPGFRVDYDLQSWIDTATFSSLRFRSESNEGGRRRRDEYEIFPDRGVFVETQHRYDDDSRTWTTTTLDEQPAVSQPLDQAAFLFFIRTQQLDTGAELEYPRYFRPDRNPVRVSVLRREKVNVPAGAFASIVVRPVFRSRGIFSENGRAEAWFTDDDRRLMIRMETSLPFGSVSLRLREFQNGLR